MIRITALDHVAIPVSDMERSIDWYQKVFGLTRRFEAEWGTEPAFLCIGESCVALLLNRNFPLEGVPPTVRHFCFRTSLEGFDDAVSTLREMGIPFSVDDHQVSLSLYFQDPDRHWIEITTYDRKPLIQG